MKELKFKTNINCGGCVAGVTPFLNNEKSIKAWQVYTSNPNKILTVSTENLSENDVIKLVQEAGFKAEKI